MVRWPSSRAGVPWERLYDYVLTCGREHDPASFVATVLDEAGSLVPFDQGIAYSLDEQRRVQSQHLRNIKKRWSNMYIDYYSRLASNPHALGAPANERRDLPFVVLIDWTREAVDEFVANYIMGMGVRQSLGFVLFDQNGLPRAAFSLDRTRDERFTERDLQVMRMAAAQLGNLYKNFFTDPARVPGVMISSQNPSLALLLTKREREVVDLLCQGLSPALVASTLHISTATAYKHIAHIYKKLEVSSRQELLVRILGAR